MWLKFCAEQPTEGAFIHWESKKCFFSLSLPRNSSLTPGNLLAYKIYCCFSQIWNLLSFIFLSMDCQCTHTHRHTLTLTKKHDFYDLQTHFSHFSCFFLCLVSETRSTQKWEPLSVTLLFICDIDATLFLSIEYYSNKKNRLAHLRGPYRCCSTVLKKWNKQIKVCQRAHTFDDVVQRKEMVAWSPGMRHHHTTEIKLVILEHLVNV